jgi:hypothetical protein
MSSIDNTSLVMPFTVAAEAMEKAQNFTEHFFTISSKAVQIAINVLGLAFGAACFVVSLPARAAVAPMSADNVMQKKVITWKNSAQEFTCDRASKIRDLFKEIVEDIRPNADKKDSAIDVAASPVSKPQDNDSGIGSCTVVTQQS